MGYSRQRNGITMQILAGIGGLQSGVAMTFSTPVPTTGGFTVSVTNYDALWSYSVSTSAGSASIVTGAITQSGLGNNVTATVTVTATRSGYVTLGGTIGGTSSPQLPTPTFSGSSSTAGGYTFTISNYDAANGYVVTTSSGSINRTGNTVTQSGLGYSVSTTASVYSTRASWINSATGTTSGTSDGAPPCDPNCYFVGYTCVGTMSYEYYQSNCYSMPCEGGYNGAYRSGICGF